jgi:hypothetical protein
VKNAGIVSDLVRGKAADQARVSNPFGLLRRSCHSGYWPRPLVVQKTVVQGLRGSCFWQCRPRARVRYARITGAVPRAALAWPMSPSGAAIVVLKCIEYGAQAAQRLSGQANPSGIWASCTRVCVVALPQIGCVQRLLAVLKVRCASCWQAAPPEAAWHLRSAASNVVSVHCIPSLK